MTQTTARTAGARRSLTRIERETVTVNVLLAVIGARGRETKRGETGLSAMEGDGAGMLKHA